MHIVLRITNQPQPFPAEGGRLEPLLSDLVGVLWGQNTVEIDNSIFVRAESFSTDGGETSQQRGVLFVGG